MSKIAMLFAAVLFFALSTHAAPPTGGPQKSVLLLRNGEVLCGAIAKVGDRYVATLGNGSELRMNSDVVKVYWENGAQIIPPNDIGIAHEIEVLAKGAPPPRLPMGEAQREGLVRPIDSLCEDYIATIASESPVISAISFWVRPAK